MKNSLVWMPFQLGSLFGAILLGLSLIALVRSNSRWDDHLINAVGVFAAGLFVSFTAWLVVTAVRPQPGVSRQTRILSILGLIAFALVVAVVGFVAWSLSNMSFV